jgi:hypothetical protein
MAIPVFGHAPDFYALNAAILGLSFGLLKTGQALVSLGHAILDLLRDLREFRRGKLTTGHLSRS